MVLILPPSFGMLNPDPISTVGLYNQSFPFRYNGRAIPSANLFTHEMEEACDYIERTVNEELAKRVPNALEWTDPLSKSPAWIANVAIVNCYSGSKETVGYHSDRLTHLGPMPTIASLSLGQGRQFYLLFSFH